MSSANKILDLNELSKISSQLHAQGKRIVLCHGVFDLMHLGHIRHLKSAREHGDVLIVSVTADRHVNRGPGRPVFTHNLRAEALASLSVTDFVCITDAVNAVSVIEATRANFYIKGPDYSNRKSAGAGGLAKERQAIEAVGGQVIFTDDITFSSSQLINNYFDTMPQQTSLYLKDLAAKYSIDEIESIVMKVKNLKILTIGDAIIDQYHYCTPLGKSAKENIVANKYLSEENFAGGTLATANHVAQISSSLDLVTVLGERNSFQEFISEQLDSRVNPYFVTRAACQTTVKRRFVMEEGQKKLFEICYLDDSPLCPEEEKPLIDYLSERIPDYDLVIVNDFGHGMLTKSLRSLLADKAKCLALNVQTNSANIGFNLITNYPQANFICIDEAEIRLATRDKYSDLKDLVPKLYNAMGPQQIVVTRGSQGSLGYVHKTGFQESPALTSFGVDKIGAGDAFFAYASACFAVGMPSDLLLFIGNAVGALKLQIVGNRAPVRWTDTLKFMTRLLKH